MAPCLPADLGDLWDKHKPDAPEGAVHPRRARSNEWTKGEAPWGDYSAPTNHGFDDFLQTQAEASNSMPNCGCFPVNHTNPGPRPPSGYRNIKPDGDQCVVGGGYASDWAYPCTDYFYPVRMNFHLPSCCSDYLCIDLTYQLAQFGEECIRSTWGDRAA